MAAFLDQWMWSCTQNRILLHEDCLARFLCPWLYAEQEIGWELKTPKHWILVIGYGLFSLILLTNHEVILEMFWSLVCLRRIIIIARQWFLELWSAKLDLQIKAVMLSFNVGCLTDDVEKLKDDMKKFFWRLQSSSINIELNGYFSAHKNA